MKAVGENKWGKSPLIDDPRQTDHDSTNATDCSVLLIVTLTLLNLDLWPWLLILDELFLWSIHMQKNQDQRSVGLEDSGNTAGRMDTTDRITFPANEVV